jgi:zinc and cadmium transporter
MTSPFLFAFLSVLGVSLLSFLGVLFFLFEESDVRRSLLYFVSLSTGALLGDVFMHMIPEMAEHAETFTRDLYIVLGGIIFSFILEKIVHWRHCHMIPSTHVHSEHENPEDHGHSHHQHPMGVVNIVGESMHNFIDGLVIAAGFLASIPIGLSTTLAVMLHELPHEVGNVAVLLHAGYSRKKALLYNCFSAAMSIVGVLLVFVFADSLSIGTYMLPFAAGNLLYIAGSDLIPELHKESNAVKSFSQLLCILLGMVLMYGVKIME